MKTISSGSFGLLIAYLVPGFTALWGLAQVSSTVQSWLGANPNTAPTVAGFFYATLASVAAGVTVSTLRWLLIDSIHHATGIHRPRWDFSQLRGNVDELQLLIEIHYRYYQFYGGMMVALAIAYITARSSVDTWSSPLGWIDVGFVVLEVAFFLGSRDTLTKYVERGEMLFGIARSKKSQRASMPSAR
jgi:hypothetical protein